MRTANRTIECNSPTNGYFEIVCLSIPEIVHTSLKPNECKADKSGTEVDGEVFKEMVTQPSPGVFTMTLGNDTDPGMCLFFTVIKLEKDLTVSLSIGVVTLHRAILLSHVHLECLSLSKPLQ